MKDADTPHALLEFAAQTTDEMASEYGRIYQRATEDPGTAGDEGEENWAALLRDWLPASYHVRTKGRILNPRGKASSQIDVVVLKPSYPPKLLNKKLWMSGGVAAAFECKNTLKAEHIRQALSQAAECKRLLEPRTGSPQKELNAGIIFGLLSHSHSWKSPGSSPVANVQAVLDEPHGDVQHPRDLIDLVCIADLAAWSRMYITCYKASYKPDAQAHLESVFGGPCGPQTALVRHDVESPSQNRHFRPIGSFLRHLFQLLALDDPSMRSLADDMRIANLGGSGSGQMFPWSLDSYSLEVRSRIVSGHFSNGLGWGEWEIAGP